jgi:hypothetical protein
MARRTESSLRRLLVVGWLAWCYGAATARADIHTDLQVRYRLDETSGSNATDSSTNGRDGTLSGTANGPATFVPSGGLIGGAVNFAGDDDYISCPAIDATNNTNKLTVAFWLNCDTREDYEQVCTKFQNASNYFNVQLGGDVDEDSDDLAVHIANSAQSGYVATTANVLKDDKWVHVAVVYDGTLTGNTNECKIYINGRLASMSQSDDIPDTLHNASDPWWIGWRDDSPANFALDGQIDDFYLFTRALSVDDIAELYMQGQGSVQFNADMANPNSKIENTTADVLAGSDEITICAWVYPSGQGENGEGMVFALDETGSSLRLHRSGGNTFRFWANWTSDGEWIYPATDNAWTAFALTYKNSGGSSEPRVRINFVDVSYSSATAPSGTPVGGDGYCVGNLSGQDNTWDGRIAHLQVFNRVLSTAELDASVREPGSIKDDLRLWLPNTSATDTNDQSGNGFNGTGTGLDNGKDSPPLGIPFVFGVTSQTRGQLEIPTNGNEPVIGVQGAGLRSKLTPTSALRNGARFITTDSWGDTPPTYAIEPSVTNLFLYGNQHIPDYPFGDAAELAHTPDVCHAVALDGDAPTVMGCKIFDFRGDAISIRNSTADLSPRVRIPRVQNNRISHCFTGIRASAVDTQINGNRVASVRDECLVVENGNCQSDGNHFFGGQWAIKVEPGAGAFKSTNDTFSDATIGYENALNSEVSQIGDGFTQHCWLRNILCRAQTSISNTVVRVARTSDEHPEVIGVEFRVEVMTSDATRSSFIGGCIYMSDHSFPGDTAPGGSTAGMKISAHRPNVDTSIIGSTQYDDEIGIWVPSAITGGTFYIKATGFTAATDRVVKIDSAGIVGTTWVIDCATNDKAVQIPAGWNNSNSITVIKEGVVTVLTPGTAYNGGP